jgi:hypothetical protein
VLTLSLVHQEHSPIVASRLHGDRTSNPLIPHITLSPTEDDANFSFQLKRRQFPVRLAFSITINKAQGQSVKHVGIDLRVPVFSHGQLYVALSRATSSQNIKIFLPEDQGDARTNNVVYPEVLDNEVSNSDKHNSSLFLLPPSQANTSDDINNMSRYITRVVSPSIDNSKS